MRTYICTARACRCTYGLVPLMLFVIIYEEPRGHEGEYAADASRSGQTYACRHFYLKDTTLSQIVENVCRFVYRGRERIVFLEVTIQGIYRGSRNRTPRLTPRPGKWPISFAARLKNVAHAKRTGRRAPLCPKKDSIRACRAFDTVPAQYREGIMKIAAGSFVVRGTKLLERAYLHFVIVHSASSTTVVETVAFRDFCRFFRNKWKDGRARRKEPNRRNRGLPIKSWFANFSQSDCTPRIVCRICRSPSFLDSLFLFFLVSCEIFVVIFITVVSPLFSVPLRQRSPVERTICIGAQRPIYFT